MPRPRGARSAAYDLKRADLIRRIRGRLVQQPRPSLRQLAEAAGVTVPTLRHYFGSRDDIVEAVLQSHLEAGAPYLARAAVPSGPFATSIRDVLRDLAFALRSVGLGDVFAMALVEGLLDPRLGPVSLRTMIDPTVAALAERLTEHQARGEMISVDPRQAALILVSPLLLAHHHQEQLSGRASHPLDVDAFCDALAQHFVRGYRKVGLTDSASPGREPVASPR